MKTHASWIEPLEARIAPAGVFTFTDVDGDLVTVKSSKGTQAQLDARQGAISPMIGLGHQLTDFTLGGGTEFEGSNITITARPQDLFHDGILHGDGFVNVGAISYPGHSLGNVTVDGDLGALDVGNGTGVAVKSLTVHSLGVFGTTTGAPDLVSLINGALGALRVRGDVVGEVHSTTTIGPVTIGGSLLAGAGEDTGAIFSDGNMGAVKIGHDVVGGAMQRSGLIESAFGTIASVTIGGSLYGGGSDDTGEIYCVGDLGAVKIGHDVKGGTGIFSGVIKSRDSKVASVSIGGSLLGGTTDSTGLVISGGKMGAVRIGGDVRGAGGTNSGLIDSAGALASVTIGGALTGGSAASSGSLINGGKMGPVKIGGDFHGGTATNAGSIRAGGALGGLALTSVTIGGSMFGGVGTFAGAIEAIGNMGPVKIGHDLIGGAATSNGRIEAIGTIASVTIGGSVSTGGEIEAIGSPQAVGSIKIGGNMSGTIDPLDGRIPTIFIGGSAIGAMIEVNDGFGSLVVKGDLSNSLVEAAKAIGQTATKDLAMGSITIGGRVEGSRILAGYNDVGNPVGGNAQIGAVKVGGDWIASSLMAGVQHAGATGFGDGADSAIGTGTISRIASITIGGQVRGELGTNNTFGFGAGKIGSFKVGGTSIPLHPAAHDDRFLGAGVAGNAVPVGQSLANKVDDGFAVHIFEV